MRTEAHAATPNGTRYMTQLAKHWSHKFEVEHDAARARIVLPSAELRMEAGPEGLDLIIETPDEDAIARLETVVAEHLMRFAFREPEIALKWARSNAL